MQKALFSNIISKLLFFSVMASAVLIGTTASADQVSGIVLARSAEVKKADFKCTDELFIIKKERFCVIKDKKVVLRRSAVKQTGQVFAEKKRRYVKKNPYAAYSNSSERKYKKRKIPPRKKMIVRKKVKRTDQHMRAEYSHFQRNDI